MLDINGQIILNSFPHPAMIIDKERKILACNETAAEVGAKVGGYCWCGFGQRASLSDDHYNLSIKNPDHPEIQCTFCRADDCLSDNVDANEPLLTNAAGVFDTYWIPISENIYLHYAIDITEQKIAELEYKKAVIDLANSNKLLEETGKISKTGGWMLDVKTNDLEWTKEVYRIHELPFDYSPTVANAIDFYTPESIPIIQEAVNSSINNGDNFDIQLEIVTAKGNRIPVRSQGISITENGEVVRIIGSFQDISKEKRKDQELAQLKERYEQIITTMSESMWSMDPDLNFTYLSPSTESVYGYTIKEWETLSWDKFVHPDDLPHVVDMFEKLKAKTISSFTEIVRVFRKDGEMIWAELNTSGVYKEGSLIAITGNSRDVTDKVLAELETEKARKEAERANIAKSTFLANMSHEIRTPLNGMLGMLELLNYSELSEENKSYVSMSKEAGKSLMTIINDVLDLARIESGKNTLHMETFSPERLVGFVGDFFWSSAIQKNISLSKDIAKPVPANLLGDKNRIRQVAMNLVGNAIKFTDKGKVTVQCDYDKKEQNLIITVTDTGIGISEKDQNHLFDTFTQADSSYKKKYQGSGLGLSIVKNFIELMKGTIEVSSVFGKGSTFTVTIPAKEVNTAAKGETIPASDHYGGLLNILVVEDNKTNLIMIQKMLEKMGHTVKSATDGKLAVETLREFEFDLVFMDIQMPVMDGVEATKMIRNDASGDFDPNILIIALTAYALESEKEIFLNSGMDEFIAKPVSKNDIIHVLNSVMAK